MDDATQARIVRAARHFLLTYDPVPERWLGKQTVAPEDYERAAGGARALRLLFEQDRESLASLPDDAWDRWGTVIITFPSDAMDNVADMITSLVTMAYRRAPNALLSALAASIDHENAEYGHIHSTTKITGCWDDRLASALLAKAKDPNLTPESMGEILQDLMTRKADGAIGFARSLLTRPPSRGHTRSHAVVAARLLLLHATDAWPDIWGTIQQDVGFGRDLIGDLAHYADRWGERVPPRLTEEQLADLYIWLEQHYPLAEDPEHDGVHYVSARDDIGAWRNALLRNLQGRGTVAAHEAIMRIAAALPHLAWLRQVVLEAEVAARRETWIPLRPEDLIRMAHDGDLRLVQNGDQLLAVVIESLRRMEEELHGETPAAQFLWNDLGDGRYRPKDEQALSDWVQLHLKHDLTARGVVVNREVQIHGGDRTDIHVDAVAEGLRGTPYYRVGMILEAKGSWHREIFEAMETQLVGRYLRENEARHGLYLVGWYRCDRWDDDDPNKKRHRRMTTEQAGARLHDQAEALSRDEVRVRAIVLDTSLHTDALRPSTRRRSSPSSNGSRPSIARPKRTAKERRLSPSSHEHHAGDR